MDDNAVIIQRDPRRLNGAQHCRDDDSRGALKGFDWLKDQLTDAERLAKVSALEPLAKDMGATLAQFSLAWCLQNSYVSTVMTGASRVEQVHENLQAMEFVDRFTPDVMKKIDRIFGVA